MPAEEERQCRGVEAGPATCIVAASSSMLAPRAASGWTAKAMMRPCVLSSSSENGRGAAGVGWAGSAAMTSRYALSPGGRHAREWRARRERARRRRGARAEREEGVVRANARVAASRRRPHAGEALDGVGTVREVCASVDEVVDAAAATPRHATPLGRQREEESVALIVTGIARREREVADVDDEPSVPQTKGGLCDVAAEIRLECKPGPRPQGRRQAAEGDESGGDDCQREAAGRRLARRQSLDGALRLHDDSADLLVAWKEGVAREPQPLLCNVPNVLCRQLRVALLFNHLEDERFQRVGG